MGGVSKVAGAVIGVLIAAPFGLVANTSGAMAGSAAAGSHATSAGSTAQTSSQPGGRLTWSIALHRVGVGFASTIVYDESMTLAGEASLTPGSIGPLAYRRTSIKDRSSHVSAFSGPGPGASDPCGSGPPDPFGYCNLSSTLLGTFPGSLRVDQAQVSRSGRVDSVNLTLARQPTETVDTDCTGDCGKFPVVITSFAAETLRETFGLNDSSAFVIAGFTKNPRTRLWTARQRLSRTVAPFRYSVDATWTLGVLTADAGGPYHVVRGGRVTLDGTRSAPPPGGSIKSYDWILSPDGKCGSTNARLSHTHYTRARLDSFVMLCSLIVTLIVEDNSGHTAEDVTEVVVQARHWTVRPAVYTESPPANSDLVQGDTLGLNVGNCAGRIDAGPKPFCPYSGRDGYTVNEVGDTGPFAGMSYVGSASFSIERLGLFNPDYQPGGQVYQHNVRDPRYRAAMQRLAAAIHVHEKSHFEAIAHAAGQDDGNVNQLLESVIGSRDAVIDRADNEILDAENRVWKYAEDGSGHLKGSWSGTLEFPDGPHGAWVAEHCFTNSKDMIECSPSTGTQRSPQPVPVLQVEHPGTVEGGGFTPGEDVSGQLHSVPLALGTVRADARGVARFTIRIPAGFVTGRHTVVMTGLTSGHVDTIAVTVDASSSGQSLAATGVRLELLVVLGLALLGGGAVLIAGARSGPGRRRKAHG